MLTIADNEYGSLRFADIRACLIAWYGGKPENGDRLPPTHERSLKRAMKALVDRGDVLIVSGMGGGRVTRTTTSPSSASPVPPRARR
ncbi:MAG: hypothetical protein ACLPXW_22210 [Xanthobacteraceae bacterium]